ncbi:MAG: hypothetical protein JKX73_06965 [Flavobacteriales bacterium]|nr:hypothetical protein [Flavobacteriales bacterium]
MNRLIQVVSGFLVTLTIISGIVKLLGVRMDFMRITHVEFENWQISVFGIVQIVVGLLVAWPKYRRIGLIAYSAIYLFASYFYFKYDLNPKLVPLLLSTVPLIILGFKIKQLSDNE